MKQFISFFLVSVMLFSFIGCKVEKPNSSTATPDGQVIDNTLLLSTVTPEPTEIKPITKDESDGPKSVFVPILKEGVSDFDSITSLKEAGGWFSFASGTLELSPNGVDESQCIKFSGAKESIHSYSSPAINLYNVIKEAGTYYISYEILLAGDSVSQAKEKGFDTIIRGSGEKDKNSFIVPDASKVNYRGRPETEIEGEIGEWMQVEIALTVLPTDLDGKAHTWNLCMDSIDKNVAEMYIDNFQVYAEKTEPEEQKLVSEAETWVASEMTFIADFEVPDPVNTQRLDVEFTNGMDTLTMPGFWDGTNVWRVRFALPKEGTWTYKTTFSDTADTGVHNITGSIAVTKYSGDLEIYKHGFVTTKENTKYFVYADGTPFFYLGDTHWNFLTEEYDEAGPLACEIDTVSHFKYIVNRRVAQGYTVYQSEPLGAPFDLSDGISGADIPSLRLADKYFKYIADQGLVHANAQFFFPDVMMKLMDEDPEYETILDTLARNWVARYGAYPVMWTMAQEVDNDFYITENKTAGTTMSVANNPWKKVCELMHKYDPYRNPISAHQETSTAMMDNTSASNSAFREVEGHSWWATQWKPVLNQKLDFSAAKDFWENGQNKPIVMYEGRYEGLWTNEYGARAQGWLAFLNGMYGHGYGAVDIWLYKSNYDMEKDTVRDGINITLEEKSTPWGKSVEFAAGYQMGYMKDLLERYEWWRLTPAFEDSGKFVSDTGTYSMAHIEDEVFITYFYDLIDKEGTLLTGTLKGLDASSEYNYYWFNPRTTAVSEKQKAINNNGSFTVGDRPSAEDWVLVVEKG